MVSMGGDQVSELLTRGAQYLTRNVNKHWSVPPTRPTYIHTFVCGSPKAYTLVIASY